MASAQSGVFKVYSFTDVFFTMSHSNKTLIPDEATIDANGVGSITISNDGERSTKQLAADGAVLISKIRDRTGTLTLDFLQSSPLHNQLMRWFNALEDAPAAEWAKMNGLLRSRATDENTKLTGICFVRIANKAYAAQGQNVQWQLLVADVSNFPNFV
jgi:hypothetical protein